MPFAAVAILLAALAPAGAMRRKWQTEEAALVEKSSASNHNQVQVAKPLLGESEVAELLMSNSTRLFDRGTRRRRYHKTGARRLFSESEVTELLMSNSTSAASAFCQPGLVGSVLRTHLGMACGGGRVAERCEAACNILPAYIVLYRSQAKHCAALSIESVKDLFNIFLMQRAIAQLMGTNRCGSSACPDAELRHYQAQVIDPEKDQCMASASSANEVDACLCAFFDQLLGLYEGREACGTTYDELVRRKRSAELSCSAHIAPPAAPAPCPQDVVHWREQVLVPQLEHCMASASSMKDAEACNCDFFGQMVKRYTDLTEREACGTMYDEPLERLKSQVPAYCEAPTPSPTQAVQDCHALCQAAGYCCNDPTKGSNQLVSCAQACMMRRAGLSETELLTTVCGQRACSTTVSGITYPHCDVCTDRTSDPKCAHGVPSSEACQYGASHGLEATI